MYSRWKRLIRLGVKTNSSVSAIYVKTTTLTNTLTLTLTLTNPKTSPKLLLNYNCSTTRLNDSTSRLLFADSQRRLSTTWLAYILTPTDYNSWLPKTDCQPRQSPRDTAMRSNAMATATNRNSGVAVKDKYNVYGGWYSHTTLPRSSP